MANNKVHKRVTETILAELETGVAPWVKPWTDNPGAPVSIPQNAQSGRLYNGGNIVLCWIYAAMAGYTDQRWITPSAVKRLPGARWTGKYNWITRPDIRKYIDDDGNERQYVAGFYPMPVLNVQQCTGLPLDIVDLPEPGSIPAGAIADFVATLGIEIRHGGNRACFIPKLDVVESPNPDQFKTEADYYATLFHELVHATGHESRLDRFSKPNQKAYAFEELVAELGAAFLCAEWQVEGKLQHPAYIEGWITLLKDDETAFMRAAAQASKAVKWMADKANAAAVKAA